MRAVLLVVLLALLPLVSLAAPTQTPIRLDSYPTSSSSYCMGWREAKLVSYINAYRVEHGLRRLTPSKTLGAAARHHSKDMARYDYFGHFLSGEGVTWVQNILRHGYPSETYRGENIAAGNSDPYKTFLQWKNSTRHNAVLLSPTWRAIGVGRYYYAPSTWDNYWTMTTGNVVDVRAYAC